MLRHRPGHLAAADVAAVDVRHGGQAPEGARDEGLVGGVDVVQREVEFARRKAGRARYLEHFAAGDAAHAVVAGRGPQLAAAHAEEVGRVAGAHHPAHVEHEGLVGAGLEGLDEGLHLVQLRVAVEARVEVVRRAAAHGAGVEAHAAGAGVWAGHLVLGDDDEVGSADGEARVLGGRLLDAARHHHAHVDAVGHRVGRERALDFGEEPLARPGQSHPHRRAGLPEAVEVGLREDEAPVV